MGGVGHWIYWQPMNADERQYWDGLTERVIGAVFEVSNTLRAGFLEKVYERALGLELRLRGLRVTSQTSYSVTYKGQCVGQYYADLLVEDVLIVELKCTERLVSGHMARCLNYLRRLGGWFACWLISRGRKWSGSGLSAGLGLRSIRLRDLCFSLWLR